MAKYDIKFIDAFDENISVRTFKVLNHIDVRICQNNNYYIVRLDKSTAIKFAKTLRTEINKITESEVLNG